ncbi:alpha/beta hydrolase [Sphingomonas sp.]|uniref:alpha/beta hydrolase n=1 Tax=Sphingomonas sp. TaxID=28214 RepID=UPI00286A6A45|nr:alpha/beta hydrolase [Sphingomonas sp.]
MNDDALKLVDPELIPALDLLPNLKTLSHESLAELRALLAEGRDPDPVPGVTTEWIMLPGRAGAPELRALLHRPTTPGPHPAVLNIHGGGYVAGTAAREDGPMQALCAELGAVILSVEYRLAPENPFPAALDDAWTGVQWLHEEPERLAIDPARIAVRGVSAGGGIAVGLALAVRDRNGPPIAFLSLVYPMLDDRTGEHPAAGRHVWPIEANRFGWSCYVGDGDEPSIYAAPARCVQLAGLPPTFIATGSIDLFIDEDLRFAQRLMHAGVPTELHVYPGAYHGFTLIATSAPARQFERDSLAAFRRAIGL